jgi:cyanophycinase-like exopeptidase
MVKVHRALIEQAGAGARAMLDTPFGFQANADDLTEKVLEYFADSVGERLEVARWRRRDEPVSDRERSLALLERSSFVFAGPGSPTYALRQWQETPVPRALVDVVGRGGTVVLGSAAAVTVGSYAVPVYEIYKVGEDPRWEPGIGLMNRILGWRCAVIPHYDNREGGTHDTRFCYVGGRRLGQIESDLGDGFILGVDEHTALVLDLDAGTAWVGGRSAVTLRVAGVEDVVPNGARLSIAEIEDRIAALGAGAAVGRRPGGPDVGQPADPAPAGAAAMAMSGAADATGASGDVQAPAGGDENASGQDAAELARTVLAALPDSATMERAAVVALVHQAEAASATHDRELAGRAVQALVDVRADSRAAGDWAASDRLRDVLAGVGVEVRDSREGSTWQWM